MKLGWLARLCLALTSCTSLTSLASAQRLRLSETVEDLEIRASRDSLDPAAHYNLALGYFSRSRYVQAESSLARAVALDPQFAPGWLALSVVRDLDERHWSALRRSGGDSAVRAEARSRLRYSRRAYLIDPYVDLRILGAVSRFEDRGDALQYYFGRDFRRFADGYREGMRGLVEGNHEAAFSGFQLANTAWIQATGSLVPGRLARPVPEWLVFHYAVAAARANRLPLAIELFDNLVSRNLAAERQADTTVQMPLATNEYRYMLAAVRQRAGDSAAARRLYFEVIENDIGNYMAQVQAARMAEAANDWAAAVAARRAAVNANPEDHTMHLDLGVTLARVGRWDEAEAALVEAGRINPRDPRVAYRLGIVQQHLGKRAEAVASLERFVAQAPSRYANAVTDARARLAQLR
jgi:tetratricopeptide (TPR) repeat protein